MSVAERWGSAAFTHTLADIAWMASPAVLLYLNERATGDPARDWLSGWARRYFVGDDLRVLVLGCGEGWLERAVAGWPFVAHIDAVDIAEAAVARARETAASLGLTTIDYGVLDLNHDSLRIDAYDVVIAHSILHHVENLEHAFDQIERTMRPEAVLIVNEYVGPARFQFSDRVLTIINELLPLFPERLRRSALEEKIYSEKERPSEAQMIAIDPSEAVRSDELMGFIGDRFTVLDQLELGGTVLQHLLYDVVQNFRFDQPRERAMLELLCAFEGALVDEGAIGSDFVIVAAQKKTARAGAASFARELPPRPAAALHVDRDPLGFGSRSRTQVPRPWSSRTLPAWLVRVLRIVLVSSRGKRANLVEERPLLAAIERFRYALSSPHQPFRWVIGRWLPTADLEQEDDRAILAILRTFAKILADTLSTE